ncbi:MAG: DUF4438 domain-containing protein [Candidatus Brocadiales bacterium]|nr:DUF4438 domain-containing protein [Candidatus Bathyanammoxibius amoris]
MLRTNVEELVSISVFGEVASPVSDSSPYTVSAEGQPVVLPGVGGITYNVKVGDTAVNWAADHVEPGVSVKNTNKEANAALNLLACVGNRAWVSSGDAKGGEGVVTGKHGGIEHVLMDFADDVLEKLAIGDKIMVRGQGVGLKFLDYPEVKIMNLTPEALNAIPIKVEKGTLLIPVTHQVPAGIMGSGLGSHHSYRGDYDIQLFDETTVKEYNLRKLNLGDLVAIMDADHSFGRIFRKGAVTVGVVVHTNSVTAGHGPGVTTLFTSSKGRIKPEKDTTANIARYMNLGCFRPQKGRKK